MTAWSWLLVAVSALLVLYVAVLLSLAATGRRGDVRAVAGFLPDCVVLFRRLLRASELTRSGKLALGGLVAYLAMPFDLVPDFLPAIGQLDDVLVVLVVLRYVIRGIGTDVVRREWPGPERSLALVLRSAGVESPVSSR